MSARTPATAAAMLFATLTLAAAGDHRPHVSVEEGPGGAFLVSAHFSVPEPPDVVRRVLTDYENISRFVPNVETSRVLDREEGIVRVEQEAVSRYLWFSKRVRLLLEVEEGIDAIRFRDLALRSFEHYEGVWTIAPDAPPTAVGYELAAKPAFGVPGFVLRKLLDRDARAMIDGLRAEIRARATAS